MTSSEILLAFVFLMAYYYFILRKYNALGFRIFSICLFTSLLVCYWWYDNYRDLKAIQQQGVLTEALLLKKAADTLTVRFTDQSSRLVEGSQLGGISVDEFAAVSPDKPVSVLYVPDTDIVFLASSFQRQIGDHYYILFLPGLLMLIGIVCLVNLRKYKVHAHEGTIYEYVTNEHGDVVLDDARNSPTKRLRTDSSLLKLLGLFDK